MKFTVIVQVLLSLGVFSSARAAEEVAQSFTMDGRLYSDSAATTPLLDTSSLKLQIINPAQTCILYEETQSVNTVATSGYYTIRIGQKKGGAKRSSGDSNNFFSEIFSNTPTTITGKLVSDGTTACTYTPVAGDTRYLRVTITPSSDNIARTTTSNMLIDAIPSALVAERAETLQGFAPTDFVKTTDLGTGANKVVQMTAGGTLPSADGSLLTALNPANLSGTVAISKGGTGQSTATAAFDALSPLTTKGDIVVHNGTNNIRLAVGTNTHVLTADSTAPGGVKWAAPTGGSDASYAAKGIVQFNTDAATSGITVASGVATLNTGTGANQIVKLDGSSKLPAVDGSALTSLNASNIASGTLAIARGGTGLTSFSNGRVLTTHSTTGVLQDTTCSQYQVISFDASGNWYCANVNTLSGSFINGGNSFTGLATLGTNDAYGLAFETAGSTRMTIDSSGNVGVGTTSPGAPFDINGNARALASTHGQLAVSSTDAFAADKGGTISLGGRFDGTTTLKTYAMIGGFKESSVSGNEAGYLAFATRVNGSLPAERMRISSDGKVGIGTSATPASALEVVGTEINGAGVITIKNTSSSAYIGAIEALAPNMAANQGYALTVGKAASNNDRGHVIYNHVADNSTSNYLGLGLYNSDNTLRVTGAGQVGIGRSPAYTFDVARSGIAANTVYDVARFAEASTGSGLAIQYKANSGGTGVRSAVLSTSLASTNLSLGTASNNGAVMTIQDSDGYVGVGTTNPLAKFEVVEGAIGLRSQTVEPELAMWAQNTNTHPGTIYFIGSRSNATARPNDNDVLGHINFGSVSVQSVAITAVSSENQSSSAGGGFLAFRTTANTTTNLVERMRIENNGYVGIGTDTPRSVLDVNGAIVGTASLTNPTSTIDFLKGNIQHTSDSCGSYAFHNLKDGGSYMFVVKGTAIATCSFTAFTDAGTTALTVHLPPGHGATTNGKHTVYKMAVSGSDVYFDWVPGY